MIDATEPKMLNGVVPIGKKLRQQQSKKKREEANCSLSLEAQIAALEKDLLVEEEVDSEGRLVVLKSKSLVEERIQPLHASFLPSATCGFSSGHSSAGTKRPQSKVRFDDSRDTAPEKRPHNAEASAAAELLDEIKIRQLLTNYTVERRPFWCRLCRFQGSNNDEFLEHRESDFHKKAIAMEQKMCHCRMCKRSFTSAVQLKEHMTGKLHHENLNRRQVPAGR